MSKPGPVVNVPRVDAKLRVPRPTRRLVHRARLENRLLKGDEPLLTLISAPAGFGKTTLLAEWVVDRHRPTAWLALDSSDADAVVFWSNLIAAVQAVVPDAGSEALSLLQAGESALQAVTASLLNDLEAFATDLVVVLDDYHFIESTDVHESLAFVLEHLPPQVHFVIASRVDPALPLARMRARRTARSARCRPPVYRGGSVDLLPGHDGIDLSAGEVGALEARTEGWIAALQLAALSMQGRETSPTSSPTSPATIASWSTTSSRRSSDVRATTSASSCWTLPFSRV